MAEQKVSAGGEGLSNRLAEIRKRLAGVISWPWNYEERPANNGSDWVDYDIYEAMEDDPPVASVPVSENTAVFITNAPEDVDVLLSIVEEIYHWSLLPVAPEGSLMTVEETALAVGAATARDEARKIIDARLEAQR